MSKLDDHLSDLEENTKLIERVKYQIETNGETNSWEDDFLESILEQLVNGRTLSPAQISKLEQIEDIEENGRYPR